MQNLTLTLDRAAESGLDSLPRLRVLLALLDRPRTLTELAVLVGRSTAALTGIIDKMTGAGLLERTRPHLDRRRYRIVLTPAGRQTAAHILGE